MISIQLDEHQMTSLKDLLADVRNGAGRAVSRAINRSLTSVRSEVVRMVTAEYAVKSGEARKELKIYQSNAAALKGEIYGSGSPGIPLMKFAKTSVVPSTKRTKGGGYSPAVGIPVLVKKSTGKTAADGVFLARMKSGHVGAFWRTEGRKIEERWGPSPLKLMGQEAYVDRIEDYADRVFAKNLEHEINYLMSKKK